MPNELDQLLDQARAKESAGDLKGAAAVLDAAPETFRGGAWHYARGAMALRGGQLAQAVTHFEAAVAKEPEVAEYRSNLGAALLEQAKAGDQAAVAKALAALELAVAWGPTLPGPHTNLSVARLMSGDAAGALKAADQAIAIDPKHAPALYNRAAALNALGRLEDCLAALDATLAAAPGYAPALTSRANTLQKLRRA
jgi:tetratricopeptide (TPR) repeat protein